MNYYEDLTQLIGQTPLLRLRRLAPDIDLFAKCEFMNPVSLKDRPVLQIVEDAEAAGLLRPGSTLIEATSGNTGMAVAFIAALRDYRVVLVMSEIQSRERRQILRALGAELVLTPASEGTVGARKKLNELLAQNPDYFYVGQHVNQSNPKAHTLTTGPELWQDTDGQIDVLVAGLGTGTGQENEQPIPPGGRRIDAHEVILEALVDLRVGGLRCDLSADHIGQDRRRSGEDQDQAYAKHERVAPRCCLHFSCSFPVSAASTQNGLDHATLPSTWRTRT